MNFIPNLVVKLFLTFLLMTITSCVLSEKANPPNFSPLDFETAEGKRRVKFDSFYSTTSDSVQVWLLHLPPYRQILGYYFEADHDFFHKFQPDAVFGRKVTVNRPDAWKSVTNKMSSLDIWRLPDGKDIPESPWLGEGTWVVVETRRNNSVRRVVYNTPGLGKTVYHRNLVEFIQWVHSFAMEEGADPRDMSANTD